MTSSNTASSAWNTIVAALNRGWLIGCDTGSTSIDGLPGGHAETLLGAYVLRDTSGNVVAYLYRIRNPWGIDAYNGPWSDNDSRWTSYYKSQVPYVNANDGYFFMDYSTFLSAYLYFTINFYT